MPAGAGEYINSTIENITNPENYKDNNIFEKVNSQV